MEAALIKSPKKSVWMPLYQSGVSASCAYKIIWKTLLMCPHEVLPQDHINHLQYYHWFMENILRLQSWTTAQGQMMHGFICMDTWVFRIIKYGWQPIFMSFMTSSHWCGVSWKRLYINLPKKDNQQCALRCSCFNTHEIFITKQALYNIFTVCILLCVTNIWLGKVSINTIKNGFTIKINIYRFFVFCRAGYIS
jgi:hypothetical protein